jgi:hypothetical protein
VRAVDVHQHEARSHVVGDAAAGNTNRRTSAHQSSLAPKSGVRRVRGRRLLCRSKAHLLNAPVAEPGLISKRSSYLYALNCALAHKPCVSAYRLISLVSRQRQGGCLPTLPDLVSVASDKDVHVHLALQHR